MHGQQPMTQPFYYQQPANNVAYQPGQPDQARPVVPTPQDFTPAEQTYQPQNGPPQYNFIPMQPMPAQYGPQYTHHPMPAQMPMMGAPQQAPPPTHAPQQVMPPVQPSADAQPDDAPKGDHEATATTSANGEEENKSEGKSLAQTTTDSLPLGAEWNNHMNTQGTQGPQAQGMPGIPPGQQPGLPPGHQGPMQQPGLHQGPMQQPGLHQGPMGPMQHPGMQMHPQMGMPPMMPMPGHPQMHPQQMAMMVPGMHPQQMPMPPHMAQCVPPLMTPQAQMPQVPLPGNTAQGPMGIMTQGYTITPAHNLSNEQVGQWIFTLAHHHSWGEEVCQEYRDKFIQSGLTGPNLSQLLESDLEKMGISILGHRLTIFQAIRGLYPGQPVYRTNEDRPQPTPPAHQQDPTPGVDQHQQLLGMPNMVKSRGSKVQEMAFNSSHLNWSHVITSTPSWAGSRQGTPSLSGCDSMSESASMYSASDVLSVHSNHSRGSHGRRQVLHPQKSSFKLVVTLDQRSDNPAGALFTIKQAFTMQQFQTEVQRKEDDNTNTEFIVIFKDQESMNRALSMKEEIGFPNCKQYTEPTKKNKGPRPTPAKPLLYKVLNRAKLREGKSMKSTVLGYVNKGDIYFVNQIKGKRARLVRRFQGDNGDIDPAMDQNMGWVSLRNNSGMMLMSQYEFSS